MSYHDTRCCILPFYIIIEIRGLIALTSSSFVIGIDGPPTNWWGGRLGTERWEDHENGPCSLAGCRSHTAQTVHLAVAFCVLMSIRKVWVHLAVTHGVQMSKWKKRERKERQKEEDSVESRDFTIICLVCWAVSGPSLSVCFRLFGLVWMVPGCTRLVVRYVNATLLNPCYIGFVSRN